jgi:hypothetical protein
MLGGTYETQKNSEYSRNPGRSLNPGHLDHEAGILPTRLRLVTGNDIIIINNIFPALN